MKGKKITTAVFIEKASIVHDDCYTYDNVIYTNNKTKVIITCPEHGNFQQTPNEHLKGKGCPFCGRKSANLKNTLGVDRFIKRAINIHENKYTYKKVAYKRIDINVTITCPVHGDFLQTPNNHLKGQGCPTCNSNTTWSYTDWEKAGNNSSNFESFKLYIIECWNEDERFIKIGKTFTSIGKRFLGKYAMPYQWRLQKIIEGSSRYISILETELLNEFSTSKYQPLLSFSGQSECFCISALPKVLENTNPKHIRHTEVNKICD